MACRWRRPRDAADPARSCQRGAPRAALRRLDGGAPGSAPQQFVEPEGLGEIVVGTRVQPTNHVLDRIARRQHDDRHIPSLASQLGGDLEPVLLRQHDVEQDHVILVDMSQHRGLIPFGRHIHDMTLLLQPVVDETGHLRVVLDYQNLHGHQSGEGA